MTFVPPQDDKIKKLGKKEKIPAYIYADPDDPTIIYIKTNGVIQIVDNSMYEAVINNLQFEDGEIVDKYTQTFVTEISPCLVDIDDVLVLCNGMEMDKRDILMHIRTASEACMYWGELDGKQLFSKENIKEKYYPFYMYVKYKAAVESLKEFYITAVTHPYKYKDELSDLAREEEYDLDAIAKLLNMLEDDAEYWLGQVTTITADPEWALRGKYSYAISLEFSRPYHGTYIDKKGGNGWTRGY